MPFVQLVLLHALRKINSEYEKLRTTYLWKNNKGCF